jgi:tetratricopeptide (TPR) repeat protein
MLHVLILLVVPFVVFSNTLQNDYYIDSIPRVKDNTELERFWPPSRFFTDRRTGSTNPRIAEYRPMMPLSHAINTRISKFLGIDRLAGFHLGNILVHACSAILLYFIFCHLLRYWGVQPRYPGAIHYSHQAFAAALIFAVHPIAGAAVNYIAARDLLLMTFFFLTAFLVYIRMRREGDTVIGWLISLALLSIAILSKQLAVMGFGLVFLYEWVLVERRLTSWGLWLRTALFGLPTVMYFILRWALTAQEKVFGGLRTVQGLEYPLTMLKAHLFYYFKHFVWPFDMRALPRIETVESLYDTYTLTGLVFILLTLLAAWLLRKRNPLISFSILAYWCLFSLTSSIFPFRFIVLDYRQYLPLTFLSLIVALACFSIRNRAIVVVLLGSLLLYFSGSTYYINTHWRTEESLWAQSVKHGGRATAHVNYARVFIKTNPALAEYHLLEALRLKPTSFYANVNLGVLRVNHGRHQEGLEILYRAVDWFPNWADAHYYLSQAHEVMGNTTEQIEELKLAAELDPRALEYPYKLALTLQSVDQVQQSVPYLERVLGYNPEYELAGFMMGFAYQVMNKPKLAEKEYRRFLVFRPDYFQAWFNLAYLSMQRGDCDTAIEYFTRVITLNPQYTGAHNNLAKCYRAVGNELKAQQHEQLYLQGKMRRNEIQN